MQNIILVHTCAIDFNHSLAARHPHVLVRAAGIRSLLVTDRYDCEVVASLRQLIIGFAGYLTLQTASFIYRP